MGVIRDQVQTQTLSSLTPQQTATAGGQVFVSANAIPAQRDLNDVVGTWQSVHVPTYGMPIPGTGSSTSGDDTTGVIYTAGTNEVAYVQQVQFTNTGADDVTVIMKVGGVISYIASMSAGELAISINNNDGLSPFYLAGGQTIEISRTGGSAGDLSWALALCLSSQG